MDSDLIPIIGDEEIPPVYSELEARVETGRSSPRVPVQASVGSTDLPQLKVYKRRWYILALFCGLACHQCIVWNTFGPIETAVEYAYGWPDSTAPMMANWGCIMFVISVVPLSKLAEYNMRITVLLVSGLVALGTVLRCIHCVFKNNLFFLISSHACAILNGISGVTIMAAPPLISSHWFPPEERTTATSINQAANMLGNGLSMLVGPALVPWQNDTTVSKSEVQTYIDHYMLLQAGIAVLLFLLFIIYFPAKPPLPPTVTSAINRTEFWAGVKQIFKNRSALLLCFSYSMGGVLGSWLGVMVNNFRPLGITDKTIGMIGVLAVLGQVILTTLVGFLMDKLKHKMKLTLLILISLASLGFIWLMWICLEIVPHSEVFIYLSVILSASIAFACYPIFFEMTVEIMYPVHESIVGGFLTGFYNLVGIVFLLLFFIPNIGFVWINYALVAATVIGIPAVLLTKETYNRSNVDEAATNVDFQ